MNEAPGRRRPVAARSTPGDVTRERIHDAGLETLRAEGFLGTTARSIARTGGFNQALVFYHFGSVDEVLLSGVERMSQRRLATYRAKLAGAADLPQIVAVAREALSEDVQRGAMTVLSQLVAGAHGRPDFSRRLADSFEPWIELVEQAVQQALDGTGLAGVLPSRQAAVALTGTFVGVELLGQLDPESGHVEALLGAVETTADLLQGVLALLGAGSSPTEAGPPPA